MILVQGDEYKIEAEATTNGDTVTVGLRQARVTAEDLPKSVLHYVVRTKESVLLDDASGESQFSADEYIPRHHPRSILCLPLLRQTRLIGLLYLENHLASHMFAPAHVTVLKLLASEAAISLENSRLYADLQEREAKVRRLVDSNIIGVFLWGPDDRIIDANEAFLRLMGYDRDDLAAGRLHWRELTPPEWREADAQREAELKTTGVAQPYEKEYFRKRGGRVPVLVGAATFEGGRNEGISFVVDLTDRKKAEDAMRESEARYRDLQTDLAHANRVATMGQMSASIAHEINQPITAASVNATAALRWLRTQPPDLEKVQQASGRIVVNAGRAGEVIGRVRALFKKARHGRIHWKSTKRSMR